jgi:membrane-associated phospholipid phosphatase
LRNDLPRHDAWRRDVLSNLDRWVRVVLRPPRAGLPPIAGASITAIVVTLAVVIDSMVLFDVAASDWARGLPQWFEGIFEQITNFGLSGWFLFPFGFVLLCLAALQSPALTRMSQGVLAALAVRFGFLFLAIGLPGLFVAIIKRMIGRARPYVGPHDDPFAYLPFAWRPEYASMPSGHSTTAASAAIAIGAIWPRSRGMMWLYALIIMFSRVVVLAHHPSDVIAGALVGIVGAVLVRRWFAARRLLFAAADLRTFAGPSWQRIKVALREAVGRWGRGQKA